MERLAGSLPLCYRLNVAEFAANVYFGGNAFIFYLYDVPVRLALLSNSSLTTHNHGAGNQHSLRKEGYQPPGPPPRYS